MLALVLPVVALNMPSRIAVAQSGNASFEREVVPLLLKSCLGCHNSADKKGGFDLSTAKGAFEAGEDGVRIIASKPAESLLLERLVDGSMPPEGKQPRPTARQIKSIREWIAGGARWPNNRVLSRYEVSTDSWAGRDWWSLQPLRMQQPPPAVQNMNWVHNQIDQFILAGLEAKSLQPSQSVDRRQFLRRTSFDLLGLPPSPEAVEHFEQDTAPDAVDRMVEQLLASPHYGERWGRYWLDVIGFTESDGFEHDKFRPHAWRYRDYVIDSFNADLSYRQFVRQQIAGDVLPEPTRHSIAGTGFLVSGEWDEVQNVGASKSEMRRAHEEQIAELVGTVTGTFLGLTVNCCRCHDHKFDPLPQTDYYRIKAVFDGVDHRGGKNDDGSRSILPKDKIRQLELAKVPLNRQRDALKADLARIRQLLPGDAVPSKGSRPVDTLVDGRHGQALNAAHTQATLPSKTVYHQPPLTIECWALARSQDNFNVFVANNLKSSGEHWELYSFSGKGDFSVYMPGYEPATIRSNVVITDGRWHYLAMQFDGSSVRMYVDGRQVKHQLVTRKGKPGPLGTLDFGGYTSGPVGCDGAVDDVRISNTIRPINQVVPAPFTVDKQTVGLWTFDTLRAGRLADLSRVTEKSARQDAERRTRQLTKQLQAIETQLGSLVHPMGYIGFRHQPEATYVLLRGDIKSRGPRVVPRGLSVFPGLPGDLQLTFDAPEAERRLKFADWITDRANPLTARVIVNRIWQFHFGNGLVKTASDFGFNGGKPTHPRLLDWLANELIRTGWSLKHIHRLIISSATYRQSTLLNKRAAAIDADNQLLWRFTPRRLDAEVIRDTMLDISGALDRKMRGPSFQPFTVTVFNTHFYHLFDSPKPEFNRRTVYRANVITGRDPLLDCFDCPSPSVATPRRRTTITPTQALALMNNSFVLRQSRLFAARVKESAGEDVVEQIDRAFQLALTRQPTRQEHAQMLTLIREHDLSSACWVLLNSSEFLYSN
jgi:hypothetical protein